MRVLAIAGLAAWLLGTAPPAHGALGLVTAANFRYVPGDAHDEASVPLRVVEGSTVVFFNADVLAPHTLTSVDFTPDGRRLFDTGPDEVQAGQAAVVVGAEKLSAGAYKFFCKLHTDVMAGELEVIAS